MQNFLALDMTNRIVWIAGATLFLSMGIIINCFIIYHFCRISANLVMTGIVKFYKVKDAHSNIREWLDMGKPAIERKTIYVPEGIINILSVDNKNYRELDKLEFDVLTENEIKVVK